MSKQRPNMLLEAKIARVFSVVAEHYGQPLAAIRGKHRARCLIEARFVGIYLAKMINKRVTWPEVAWYVDRDHTSCVYACKTVIDWKSIEPDFAEELQLVAGKVSRALTLNQVSV